MPSRRTLDRELNEVVADARAKNKVPGVAVGLLLDGRETVAVSGVTSVDNPLDVTDHTLFMIGSTSKTYCATTMMTLVEQKKVGLDDLVTRYLPRFRLRSAVAARTLTIRHLLTHTGGWDGDIEGDGTWGEDSLANFVAALRKRPQETPVGEVWSYNNSGFAVAGRIIEVVTGKSFDGAVRAQLLEPAGFKETFFLPWETFSRRFAVGHISKPKGPEVMHTWGLDRSSGPAGGVVSSVRDQLAYARFQMGDGTGTGGRRVMRRRTMDMMQNPQHEAGCFADHVGLSWMIRDVGGVRTVQHGGNVSGLQLSTFLMVPARQFAVTVLTNAGSGAAVGAAVEKWALENYLGVKEEPPPLMKTSGNDLRQYAGRYESNLSMADMRVEGNHIVMTSGFNLKIEDYPKEEQELVRAFLARRPAPAKLGLYAPDRAVVVGGTTRGEFLRARPGGPVGWFRWGGRLMRKKAA